VGTGELLLAPARAAAREFAYAPTARGVTPVLPATFGGDAGKIGAALLALDHLA
jgi:glucokinase